jgi:serine/threonine protein kinase
MNHCIRERLVAPNCPFDRLFGSLAVLDIIHAPLDAPHAFSRSAVRNQLSFIVMEEWSSQFIPPEQPHTLQSYLSSLRHCIQHIVFMHTHRFAHLDISVRNMLTDYDGRYACIDYEMSRRFCRPPVEVEEGGDSRSRVLIYQPRAAEIPPEVEKGRSTSPYAWDVWALGMLMSKAGASTGYDVPELGSLTKGMLEPQWEKRPSARMVLRRFEKAV